MDISSKLPDRLVIVAGTYDGVIAGWDSNRTENDLENVRDDEANDSDVNTELTLKTMRSDDKNLLDMLNSASGVKDDTSFLKMNFAMAVHDGSVRSLCIASAEKSNTKHKRKQSSEEKGENELVPDTLISAGYDESLAIFALKKHIQSGELKTPSNLGTPTCSSFAPPNEASPTHILIGLSSGKIVIYRKKDWSVQHILACHDDKGVNCIAVHPSGRMALSGGRDGKICLWDLMRGRLAFVHKIPGSGTKGRKSTVNDIIWSDDGKRYAFCTHEGNVTAREMETGQDLLDINLPSAAKPNQICFIGGEDGLFLAAACNNGGLPIFAVGSVDEQDEAVGTRRALMAIEPVEGVATAGDERFKCIRSVKGGSGFLVVTANSGGIISVIDLEGAAQMMLDDDDDDVAEKEDTDSSSDSEDSKDKEEDVAAEILESVRIGTGARVTALTVWSHFQTESDEESIEGECNELQGSPSNVENTINEVGEDVDAEEVKHENKRRKTGTNTVTVGTKGNEIEMDSEALERARALVSQAKKREKRKAKKKKSRKDQQQ